ncbi:MAG: STAS domain-containing protein [Nocardioidaceae bacterium]
MDLMLSERMVGDRTVVGVVGEVDVYTAPTLRDRLVELVNGGHHHLVVDLDGVDFLDSTGLGVLVGALKRVRSHQGSLQLVCSKDSLLKVFRITGLSKVFTIHDSVEQAASSAADG